MTWAFGAYIDPDKTDIGTVTGTYTDPADPGLTFVFSRRVQANIAGLQAFKADAEAALAERLTRRTTELNGIAWLENNMNP